jgi:SAM-dependent methyltransferase
VSEVVAVEVESTTGLLEERSGGIACTVAAQPPGNSLVVPESDIRKYQDPREDTIFPLEYTFHLLGDVEERTVIDLGCGNGVNTVILAALGARVFSVDIAKESLDLTARRVAANKVDNRVTLLHADALAVPIEAGAADAVLCTGMLHEVDPVRAARQIRRVLRPGGVAVFDEAVAGPTPFEAIRRFFPKPDATDSFENHVPLNIRDVDSVCRAVGMPGRRREFWLATRFVCRIGARTFSSAAKAAQRFDAAVLQHFPFTRKIASPLVWEARKEA